MIADADDQSRFIKWSKDLPKNIIKPIEVSVKLLDPLRKFVTDASAIEKETHKMDVETREERQRKKLAREMDVIISDDEMTPYERQEEKAAREKAAKVIKVKTKNYKYGLEKAKADGFQTLRRGVFLQSGDMKAMSEQLDRARAESKGLGGQASNTNKNKKRGFSNKRKLNGGNKKLKQ